MNMRTHKGQAGQWIALVLALLLAMCAAAPALYGQSLTQGAIAGTVTDPSGAVVPNATVTIKNEQTGVAATATTNKTGYYHFSLLPPATYTLSITAPSFQQATRTVPVTIGQTSTTNVQMALAAAQQTVVVEAGGGVVQTETPNVSTTMTVQQVQNVPNGGGDLSYIAQTAPGATMNTQAGYGNFSTFGLPALANNFTVNSMPENDPFLDLNNSGATNILLGRNDVQEATVVNNGYSGEYSAAGADVNYVTKSGTNNFHGNAEWWWNGRTMNANNYFNKLNSPPTPRGFVNDNQWAASFGGPIQKDKTFFFVNTEGLYVLVPVSRSINLPTPAFATAVLANIGASNPSELPLYQSMFNIWGNAPGAASAANTLKNGGCADFTGAGFGATNPCVARLHSTVTGSTHEWQLTGRLDHNFGANDKAFLHFKMDRGLQATYTDPLTPTFNATSFQPQYEGQVQWTHTLSANTVNSLSLNGSYYRAIFNLTNPAGALSLQPIEMQFSGKALYDLGHDYNVFPQGRNVTQYGFVDDASHTMGNHTFKFGANLARYDITDWDPGIGSVPAAVGETMTDFFNGVASNFTQSFPARMSQPVNLYTIGFYGTDQWHVRNNLSLTLTLRVDRYSNPACNTNCFNRFTAPFFTEAAGATLDTPYNQSILTGQKLAMPSSYHPWALSPRIGFNWSPLGTSHNTVISGGFGLFSSSQPAGFVDSLMNNLPGDPSFLLSGVPFAPNSPGNGQGTAAAAAAALTSGFFNGANFTSLSTAVPGFSAPNFFNIGDNFHVPRIQEWDLQLQQGIGTKTSISLKYVGNHGIWEQIPNAGVNTYCDATCLGSLGFTSFAGLPPAPADPRFLQVTEVTTGFNSNYNGITASLTRRFAALQFQINYTYSHALDYLSNGGIGSAEPYNFNTNGSITNPQNPFNVRQNMYGNADYDIRHYLSLNYVYTTPNNWFHSILGGWTVGGTLFWRTGMPFTVIDSGTGSTLEAFGYGTTDINFGGTFANQTGGGGSILCSSRFANPNNGACPGMSANFAPDMNGFGNQRRNQVFGPHFFDTDLSVSKAFHIPHWENGRLSVGVTAFNLFNHPNFDQPVGDVADPNFGTIQNTVNAPTSIYGSFLGADASPRLLQTQVKLIF